MKDDQPPVHQLEHAEPIVIHHPDQDMTILARWLQRGMEQGSRFWLMAGAGLVALIALSVLVSGLSAGKAVGVEAWNDLTQAKTAEDRLKIADAHPKTPVADWARLQAAYEEYDNGLVDLTTPGKKESAGPRLKKALELFRQVAKDAPKDSSQALGAALGVARTLEARNELPEAIEQYRQVAGTFPKSPEAKQALALARALEEPENVMFYKELYAYKPPATPGSTLSGLESMIPPPLIPGMTPNFGSAPGTGPKSFIPDIDAPPPSTTTPTIEAPKAEPSKPATPIIEAPKAEPAKPTEPASPPK